MCRSSDSPSSNVHPFLGVLPTEEDVRIRVNKKYDELTIQCPNGKRKPYVCLFCDEYLYREKDINTVMVEALKKASKLFHWTRLKDNRRKPELERYYKWNGNKNGCRKDLNFLNDMAMSPRAELENRAGTGRGKSGHCFRACTRCFNDVMRNKKRFLPRHAVLNRNYVGGAPECLLSLNECEVAFLTPIKNFGYCFTWSGGRRNAMKGTLSFMRVNKSSIGNGIAHLNGFGLNKNVISLYSGYMTAAQKRRAKEKSEIRVEKITVAIKWLIENNV